MHIVNVLGLDIGGANTKAVYIHAHAGSVTDFEAFLEYFPFWKRSSQQLCSMLSALKVKAAGSAVLDCVAVTLTAELSDAYRTKREGVTHILDCVCQAFQGTPVQVLNVNADLISVEAAKAEPLSVAAANWAATGWMVSQQIRDCVVVDVGSTSTSIIPIVDGEVAAVGKTDLDKLMNGELVYTGSLRTNVAATVNSVPLRGGEVGVSSEFFAQSGDVHLALGNIKESEYTAETPDGRGKTRIEALARLARVVCADTEMLSEEEILQIAKHTYTKQVTQIANGLTPVYQRLAANAKEAVPVVVTGLGRDFLARKAAEKAGIAKILSLDELTPRGVALASPAVGVALMAATKLEGRRLMWMQ
ncbi:MAG: H4MPT-linked C1 transfer pathway protein [Candidatus Bathyarchaeota archaeon]|nr:H4MPT-linked C1 transfer pathway protein [Candidatus Bathyarchaeota archaeon]